MKLLILGGTEFAGRAVAEAGVRRGWLVTVFNRGTRQPPGGVTVLRGDRIAPDGLAALAGREWDVVVDTWPYAPRPVRDAAQTLSGRAERYAYVSSRSVYEYPAPAGLAEDGPVVAASPDAEEAGYAEAKRGGELAVEAAFGDRALLVRAGLILGPHENTGRLLWWLARMARGGDVLAPGPRDLPVQYVDVRDLADWTLDALVAGLSGPCNLVSEPGFTTIGELLEECVAATGSRARLRWLTPAAVEAAGLEPWTQLPIWIPPGELHDAIHEGDVSRALASGLRCRPVAETVADTWAWLSAVEGPPPLRPGVGLDPEAEAVALAAAGISP